MASGSRVSVRGRGAAVHLCTRCLRCDTAHVAVHVFRRRRWRRGAGVHVFGNGIVGGWGGWAGISWLVGGRGGV
eukprot:4650541-Alexandrium_andersonii.AAC.1